MSNNNTKKVERPPVVVVLGHVDHGKTSLLDTIRKTNVAGREAGGITQHVGAYVVEYEGRLITFLDTPGHAAFSAMRARGAQVADIAILVVAVEDGVQPQTKEAIEAIKSADIPFVVALNKIDKPNADIEKTKTQLTEADVLLEGWGGDTPNVEISAKEGMGIDDLLELVQLIADMAELKSNPDAKANGVVIESHSDSRRGILATVLVKDGTLKVGDLLVAGPVIGKVKALEDFTGDGIKEAPPSTPTVVLGFNEVPDVGETVDVFGDDNEAKSAAVKAKEHRVYEQIIQKGEPEFSLAVVLKVDVEGSLGAIVDELKKVANEHVALNIVGASTGDISENDVKQAAAMDAKIIGFRVKAGNATLNVAERHGVTITIHKVIYELIDAVKESLKKRLPKNITREDIGTLELLGAFKYKHPNHVMGGRVESGVVKKDALLEIIRDGETFARARVIELQRDKMPVDEVEKGRECGMLIRYENGGPAEVGDRANFFTETVEVPTLE